MRGMPMLECPRCAIRQYAAASYAGRPRCVACEDLLPLPQRAIPGGRHSYHRHQVVATDPALAMVREQQAKPS
jgi:hypothetical protein